MGKVLFKNKTMICPEHLKSTVCSITCTNESINNYKILEDTIFTIFKLANPSLKLEKKSQHTTKTSCKLQVKTDVFKLGFASQIHIHEST